MMNSYKNCFNKSSKKKKELKSCNFTGFNLHGENEVLVHDGNKIGLFEVNKESSKLWNELDVDHNLAIKGPNELREELIDIAKNGAVLYQILLRADKQYFLNISGFIQREIRFIRGLYCIQQMARKLQEKYAGYSRTAQAEVYITITSVWIGNNKIYKEMKKVGELKNNLTNIIKNNGKLSNEDYENRRNKIKEGIINVAKEEDNLKLSNKKGSSMALVGYLKLSKNPNHKAFNKCSNIESKQCVSFFHVIAND